GRAEPAQAEVRARERTGVPEQCHVRPAVRHHVDEQSGDRADEEAEPGAEPPDTSVTPGRRARPMTTSATTTPIAVTDNPGMSMAGPPYRRPADTGMCPSSAPGSVPPIGSSTHPSLIPDP